MGGAVYGLLAVIVIVFLTKQFGIRRPQGDPFLIGGAVCFGAALLFQSAALKPSDVGALQFGVLCAIGGWGLVLYVVFDAVRSDDAPTGD